jgi:tetratricopeptide (TPR) repeat protein
MLRLTGAAILAAVVASVAPAQQTRPSTRPSPSPEDILAARELTHSASDLLFGPAEESHRAGRVLVLAKYAFGLDADNAETCRLLADIHQSRSEYTSAADALAECVRHGAGDYALASRWLQLRMSALNTAEQRLAFLQGAIDDQTLPRVLRTDATAERAAILARQGVLAEAADILREVLAAEPGNPLATQGLLTIETDLTAAQKLDLMLSQLRNTPMDFSLAWQAAALASDAGAHDSAADIYDYASAVWQAGDKPSDAPRDFLLAYCSALLDARRHARAIEVFQPLQDVFQGTEDMDALLVEAYRADGEDDKAKALVEKMESAYKVMQASSPGGVSSAADQAEIGWFYLSVAGNPEMAASYATRALAVGPSPLASRVLGAADVATGHEADGGVALEKLAPDDPYAAAFLAQHYFNTGSAPKAADLLKTTSARTHNGPAFRMLRSVAAKNGVTLPAPPESRAIADALNRADKRFMDMPRDPGKFLSVRMAPLVAQLPPGRPVEMKAVLENISDVPVPLGRLGLISPAIAFKVAVSGTDDDKTFENLPIASWPAGTQLAAGASIQCAARLDRGDLADFLAERPMDEMILTVTGVVDPVELGLQLHSSVKGVSPADLEVLRPSLLAPASSDVAADYQLALGRMVRDLRHGDVELRLVVARNVAALLRYSRRVTLGRTQLPAGLRGRFSRPLLLSMLRAVLQDGSPIVRSQMLAHLTQLDIDEGIAMLLPPMIDDPSPLVRLRAAEVVGVSNTPGRTAVLTQLAGDGNRLVAEMAKLFIPEESQGPTGHP